MANLNVNYDVNELGEFSNEFNPEVINEILIKKLLFKQVDDIKESFKFREINIDDYKKPYRIEFVDVKMDENHNTILNLKVKDRAGRTCPRLVPYKKKWFVCGNGPVKFKISECESLEDIARVFERNYSGEYDFAYMCVIDHNLEVVDWNSFYDWYGSQEQLIEIKKEISLL